MNKLTIEQIAQLQSMLIRFTQEFAEKIHQFNHPGLSLHIAPDMSYVSCEHELDTRTNYLIRKSPACHDIIVKL